MLDARDEERQRRLLLRWLTQGGNGVDLSVTAAATTKAVTFSRAEPTTAYGVLAMPNWGTTVWATAKATTGFTLNFGTGAPANSTVDWVVFRAE